MECWTAGTPSWERNHPYWFGSPLGRCSLLRPPPHTHTRTYVHAHAHTPLFCRSGNIGFDVLICLGGREKKSHKKNEIKKD